ncbi:TPA: HAD-IA family hydrolase [Elizabethkingia anophelis]|uniref:HAD family hydrolase n=1 Tax=Elizabethkingia anophelis TaxID=1117645 RepID=UPI0003F533D9|nr:HAD-IA family hydrolase [Elizabethkingia anophelis]MCT3746481.1 HAD-IA family hydrolase [Elizabethkingia anophelis]MDC8027946.1 HAD-IA family hydrolase [Elizabethkingia anophelis]MDV3490822.1 serine kinase [Elizabethkingia anophelis]HAT3992339.1 HAD-IA family hydrolase [Elizabethkingia anophelis]HAT3994972.1 HAD-IA family hydrolase [Elizabethkingia anophelis]
MSKYNTYIFDFDYTLADSSRGIIMCFRYVLENHGYHDINDYQIKLTIGKTLEESFSILTGITDKETLTLYAKEYVKKADDWMTANTVLFPETSPVLHALKERGHKIGIVSTKYRYRIMEFVEKEFPKEFFDIVIGAEDVRAHKPDPAGLILAINSLQSGLERCLYIGDSIIDAKTAQAIGVDFYGVLNGITTREELLIYPHIKIADNLNDLV